MCQYSLVFVFLAIPTIIFWVLLLLQSDASGFQRLVAAIIFPCIIGALTLGLYAAWNADGFNNTKDRLDTLSKAAVPAAAALYFLYQAFAGSFFATTSILLEATREKTPGNKVVVKATIERGDNWLVEIITKSDEYSITTSQEQKPEGWKPINFPGRDEGNKTLLRLAPKEKTHTDFTIDNKNGIFVTARIRYYSIGWPFPAESRAKIYVPPSTEQNSQGNNAGISQ